MVRRNRRTLRSDAQGLRWQVEPVGCELQIELVFDDAPGEVLQRTRTLSSSAEARRELERLIAEQLADGFVLQPPWEPTAEWIGTAADRELGLEVLDAWIMAVHEAPSTFPTLPPTVQAFVALHELATQSGRNGLEAFVVESDPQLVAHAEEAARLVGVPEVAALFAAAARGMSLTALHGLMPAKVRWASPRHAKQLQRYASLELDDVLSAFVRAHAQDFLPLPSPAR